MSGAAKDGEGGTVDVNTGKLINPHNPQFITQAPWYLNQQGASLSHQKAWKGDHAEGKGIHLAYRRGTKGDVKTKFKRGACENCGATTHTKKDCMERPRKVGAKFTGKNLASDEFVQKLEFDYDSKRDMYKGYDPSEFVQVVQEHNDLDEARKKHMQAEAEAKRKRRAQVRLRRAQKKARTAGNLSEENSDEDSGTDGEGSDSDDQNALGVKLGDQAGDGGVVDSKDDKTRTTTRNLRIREDTAKYLFNLDVDSAYYDPKSRSMRDDPLKALNADPADREAIFRGDNFVRSTGDAQEASKLHVFAWEAYKEGETRIHAQALPTQAAKIMKEKAKEVQQTIEAKKNELMDAYGGEEHLERPSELEGAQTEAYVEYDAEGNLIGGIRDRLLAASKYQEDEFWGGHTHVWGSYYDLKIHKWGYACCKGLDRKARCTLEPMIAS